MKYNLMNRRMFLVGMRNSILSVPFLPSLLPREAWAQASVPPQRYSQFVSQWSNRGKDFYGALAGNQKISPNVNVRALNTVAGNISSVFGAEYNEFKNKMLLIRGLDCFGLDTGHEGGIASTASANPRGQEANNRGVYTPPASGQGSVDMILARSAKVYAGGFPADRRQIGAYSGVSAGGFDQHTWSWDPNGGNLQRKPGVQDSAAIYNIFRSGFTAGGGAPVVNTNDPNLMNGVFEDYKSVRQSRQISAEDTLALDAYMGLIADIQKGFSGQQASPTCTNPAQLADSSVSVRAENQLRVIAAAMACNLTKVSSMGFFFSDSRTEQFHQIHHNIGRFSRDLELSDLIGRLATTFTDSHGVSYSFSRADVEFYFNEYNRWAKHIASYMRMLNAIPEAGGTMLDNSLIYWGQEYGLCGSGDSHVIQDYPAMLAGGAGGMLNTGYYVDLRHETERINFGKTGSVPPGLPLNNLLVTIFNAFGLGSGDYEKVGGQGYGDYGPDYLNQYSYRGTISATSYRRSPLPFIYKGPSRG